MTVSAPDAILTVADVAEQLHCSRSHVYNLINGKVKGVIPLPAVSLGRKKLVRRSSLERWLRANENSDTIMPLSGIGPVRRMEEEHHA